MQTSRTLYCCATLTQVPELLMHRLVMPLHRLAMLLHRLTITKIFVETRNFASLHSFPPDI
ncbi:hypothetical protein H6G97_23730 [Nostoc flagelliforme FACHB-838]|uniref:Uncharacterized protein n=1 Tax=Nostoc flagelliforme FACHB-838 TaxID=2692904 RepID=A0ABR8DSI7_9NOSO|nr:hypothetical protein [Nostoc flagelliforme FACHB-838]